MTRWEYTETELWRYGEGDISIYHVFGTVAVGNTVLAFAEARHSNASDGNCLHDIAMRKSIDGGRTFFESVDILPANEKYCYTNPVPVYDEDTGKLFLFYSENIGNTRTVNYVMNSDDLGESWSPACNITDIFDTPFNLAGPGHGIQLKSGEHKGRLMMQFWHRSKGVEAPAEERGYCMSLLYSDDHGDTWNHSEHFGSDVMANESRLVETKKCLIWHARTKEKHQCISRSYDGGKSWSSFEACPLPPAKNCDVGLIGLQDKEGYDDMVLMARITTIDTRGNIRIEISYDGGESFADGFDLMRGDAMPGYNDLCIINDGENPLGLLHCRNNHVLFSRISMQTLTGGKYDNTSRSVWLK